MENKSMEPTPINNSKTILAIVIGIVVIAGGIMAYSFSQKGPTQKAKDTESALMMKKDEEASMMKKESETGIKTSIDSSNISDSSVTKSVGAYVAYSAELAKTAAVKGTSVIFFHAPWCPTCKAAEADINANISKLDPKLTILKTDYDTSTELKKQYGVTSQSTFVKVDKDGKLLKKGSGFTTVDAINTFANN